MLVIVGIYLSIHIYIYSTVCRSTLGSHDPQSLVVVVVVVVFYYVGDDDYCSVDDFASVLDVIGVVAAWTFCPNVSSSFGVRRVR